MHFIEAHYKNLDLMLKFVEMEQLFIDLLQLTERQNSKFNNLHKNIIIIQHLKVKLKAMIDYKNSISLDK